MRRSAAWNMGWDGSMRRYSAMESNSALTARSAALSAFMTFSRRMGSRRLCEVH